MTDLTTEAGRALAALIEAFINEEAGQDIILAIEDEARLAGLATGMAAGIREPCGHGTDTPITACNDPRHDEIEAWYRQALEARGPDVEQIVRAALRVVDQDTPLSVGEPMIQKAIRYATNLRHLSAQHRCVLNRNALVDALIGAELADESVADAVAAELADAYEEATRE